MAQRSVISAIAILLLPLLAAQAPAPPPRPSHLQNSVPSDAIPDIVVPRYHQRGEAPVSSNETHPNAKTLASQVALGLLNYSAEDTPGEIATRLPENAKNLAATFYKPDTWSRARVIYPQLGGLREDRTSVMVVVEHLYGEGDSVRAEWRTLDIRLDRVPPGPWRFKSLESMGGDPVTMPVSLSSEALAVLNDQRIEMSDSARWDIYSGLVKPKLLRVMARLADTFGGYGVVTFSTGHPWNVFGTDKMSDHSRGLAVDLYRLGEGLVIDERAESSRTHQIVEWLYAQPEIRQIGSPWALDEIGGRSFTNVVHQDHLHIAVYPEEPQVAAP